MGLYEIRKGVPVPNSGLTGIIRKMEYLDSVDIPGDKVSSVHPCASQAGAKVKTKKNSDGTVTVWRTDRTETSASPVPRFKPKTEMTEANPDLGLPAGYYAQEDAYSPRFWVEGKPDSAKNDIFS